MSTAATQTGKTPRLGGQQAVPTNPPTVTEEQIQRRAYEIYLARGKKPGDPVQDWLQAKQELTGRLGRR